MSTRVTVRLSPEVHGEIKRRARQQGQTLAAFIRQHLKHVTTSTEPSTVPPGDAWERWLTTCLPEVQVAVRQAVAVTGLPLEGVLKALIIAACQPKSIP
jgi:HicB family